MNETQNQRETCKIHEAGTTENHKLSTNGDNLGQWRTFKSDGVTPETGQELIQRVIRDWDNI